MLLKPGRERSVLNRHPWIFSGAFQNIPVNLSDGEIIEVLDSKNNFLGYGHYCKDASLTCRMFYIGDRIVINDHFWLTRFKQAYEFRKQLGFAQSTQGYRLFYAEGDNLPGIICDVFGTHYTLQLKTQGAQNLKPLLVQFLSSLGLSEANTECSFVEDNLKFFVDAVQGQKTGYFLDQRDNRRLLGHYAKNKRVLDVFSYSGGFSLYALANQATQVTTLDISEDALKLCEKTVQANFDKPLNHELLCGDSFDYLRELAPGSFDLICLDPPAFSKNASTVQKACRGYKEINLQALKNIAPGGLLFTFSCSQHISKELFRQVIYAAAKDAGRFVRVIHELHQAPDHPVSIFHPEGEYLKGLVLAVQ